MVHRLGGSITLIRTFKIGDLQFMPYGAYQITGRHYAIDISGYAKTP